MSGVLGFVGHLPSAPRPGDETFLGWDSGWYHNSAAALVDRRGIVAAAEEERFSRVKETGAFPVNAIGYCLSQADGAVDAIAFGEEGGFGWLRDPAISEERIRALLEACGVAATVPVHRIDHHTSHAYSAATASGFDDALVVTLDGFGDGLSGSLRLLRSGKIGEPYRTLSGEDSLGMFYGSLLSYLGYRDGDEYKVMGLAPYGDPARYRSFVEEQFTLGEGGGFTVHCLDRAQMHEKLSSLGPARLPGGGFERHHADVAAAFQRGLEDMVVHLLTAELATTGCRRLCLAGGVAHNSSMLGRLAARGVDLDDIFVQPAADDSGIALGAACVVAEAMGLDADTRMSHNYLGPTVTAADVVAVRQRWGDALHAEQPEDPAADVARLLHDGHIVGSVRGRMEYGPRALGNRSIYADPRPEANQERVNQVVKSRESFRPFAPVVLASAAEEYFELDYPVESYRFMTLVGRVRPGYRDMLGAVTHVDGTARVQTVTAEQNRHLYDLLCRFGELSGVPVLLNTSLNNHREPIVRTADDAATFLLTSGVDCLELNGTVLRRGSTESVRDALAGARVRLRRGALAVTFVDGHGASRYQVVGPTRRPCDISARTYSFLGEDRRVGSRPDVAADVWNLWVERLVDVLPG